MTVNNFFPVEKLSYSIPSLRYFGKSGFEICQIKFFHIIKVYVQLPICMYFMEQVLLTEERTIK